jgi:hypothetical protein
MANYIPYDPNDEPWDRLFNQQQIGGLFFVGDQYQKGSGFLRSLLSFLMPAGRAILGEAGSAAGRILNRYADGNEDIRSMATQESRQSLRNLARKAATRLQSGGRRKRQTTACGRKSKRRASRKGRKSKSQQIGGRRRKRKSSQEGGRRRRKQKRAPKSGRQGKFSAKNLDAFGFYNQ